MTRDEWKRLEPVLTKALPLPEQHRQALLDTANLEQALRDDLMEVLRRCAASSASVAVAGVTSAPTFRPPGAGGLRPRVPVLPPGSKIDNGRYVVVRQIGAGGMGTVFLANDTTLGMLVALKVMPYDERVLTEARRAAVCSDHPHVAAIHNVLKEQVGDHELGVLVMEYVAGIPASRFLDDGPVDIGQVLKWGRQVAAAIGHAHDHQVLHCDLKPANIVITTDGRAKVLDFGISRATFDPADPAEPVRGTMPYMAPEQLLSKQFSPAGDIYSLGVTLFELATGRLPFEGDDSVLRLQILAAPPPSATELVADVPPELQKALERAMEKQPEKRFRSARSFERALEAVEAGVHYTTATVPVPARPAQLSLWGKVGIAILVLAVAIAAFTMLGAYTSAVYNQTLERADFANESVWDWLNWGFRASTGPLSILAMAILVWGVVRSLCRLALRVFDREGRVQMKVTAALRRTLGRLGPDDVTARSVAALIASASALVVAIFLYRDLFPAFVAFAATSPPEQLALLSPDHVNEHNAFRRAFSLVVILTVAAWYPVLKSADRRRDVPRGLLVGGVLTLLAAFVFLHHPHRMIRSGVAGQGFEMVRWQEHDCYALGQRGSDTLLLCPDRRSQRHVIVRTGDSAVVPLGTRESPFRGFHRMAEQNRKQAEAR